MGDVDEVFPELARDIFVGVVVLGQFDRDREHIERVHRHPTGRVRLFETNTARQRLAAVEQSNVVQPKEPALEHVQPLGVLAIDPPCEVQQELEEHALEKDAIALAAPLLVDFVDTPRRPRMDRRVHVVEGPLVRGQLSVGVHVPFAQQQHELIFREVGVDQGERHGVEREVPRRIPRILPFVRHGEHVFVVDVRPFGIAPSKALRRGRRLSRVTVEPFLDDVVIELLRPQQTRDGLPRDVARVGRQRRGEQARIKLIGFANPRVERRRERVGERRRVLGHIGEPQAYLGCFAGGQIDGVPRGRLRPLVRGICRPAVAVHDRTMKRVFDVRRRVRASE